MINFFRNIGQVARFVSRTSCLAYFIEFIILFEILASVPVDYLLSVNTSSIDQ
jgi:hypothetical protein